MYVIATTKKVAILRRFVDFSDLKCQEPENVLSRDMSRAPYKTKKKRERALKTFIQVYSTKI